MKIGVVVRDCFNREGIVCREKERPSDDWVNEQQNRSDYSDLPANVKWWGVMPLEGGLIIAPEPHLVVLRDATFEDFLVAADNANVHGRRTLAGLFPDFLARVVARSEVEN